MCFCRLGNISTLSNPDRHCSFFNFYTYIHATKFHKDITNLRKLHALTTLGSLLIVPGGTSGTLLLTCLELLEAVFL